MNYSFYPKMLIRTPARPYSDFSPQHLSKVLLDKDFQQALLMASPELYTALSKHGFAYDLLNMEHRLAAFKYYNRMSYRATPFGAFASISLLKWGVENKLMVRGSEQLLMTFPNFGTAGPIPVCEEQGLIYVNPSIYKLGSQFRYLFRQRSTGGERSTFRIMKIHRSRLLERLFKRLEQPGSYNQVVNFLTEDLQQQDGPALVTKLIKAQVLYHSALPHITGSFLQIKLDPMATRHESYSIAFHRQKGSLSSSHQNDILEGLKVLDRLVVNKEDTLLDFAEKFTKRFETAEVPLLKALDPQYGISYLGTERTRKEQGDITGVFDDKSQRNLTKEWTGVSALLLQKMSGPDNKGSISISAQELKNLPASGKAKYFPPSLWVMFRHNGRHLFIENAGGNSAVSLSGRFSHHPKILDELKMITAMEKARNPEVIFAEIAAMDDSLSDNISSRGHLRDFEIPVLVHSDLPQNQIIPLNDLQIKVVCGQVIMRSKRLNKIVIPRLASAYNYQLSNLPILRFLGDLQYQNLKCDFSFDPEFYLPGLRYYPRVMYKNTILSAAKWIWDKNVINDFLDSAHGLVNFHRMASSSCLVRWFALTSHDRQLVFDLNCKESIRYFLQIVRNQSRIILKEFFLPEDGGKIYDVKGDIYLGQFVACLINSDCTYQGLTERKTYVVKNVKSVFFPGEEWLYFKIYGHPETLSLFLAEASLYKILQRLSKVYGMNCWFFVRYADPDHHIRLRLNAPVHFVGQIASEIKNLVKPQLKNGLVTDFVIATYQPELERYGLAGMENVEKIFELSSDAVLSFYKSANTFDDQICFAISSVVEVLTVMLPSLNERIEFTKNGYGTKSASKRLQLDRYYRQQKYQLERAANKPVAYHGNLIAGKIQELAEKCNHVKDIKQLVSADRYDRFVSDLIHMHINRLNAGGSSEFEMNMYYFLNKYYRSLMGREKQRLANTH